MTPWELFMEKEVTEDSRHMQSTFDMFKEILKILYLGTQNNHDFYTISTAYPQYSFFPSTSIPVIVIFCHIQVINN